MRDDVPDGGHASADLVLELDGFEGPIDMLLALARRQKVDLTRISILKLADQYLAYIQSTRHMRLEVVADYLVMAAWLAYLKSRLLLPEEPADDEPSGEELADSLAFQLRRLEAMRAAGQALLGRDLLGRDRFARGAPDGIAVVQKPIYAVTLHDLISAYVAHKRRVRGARLVVALPPVMAVEAALRRLGAMIGQAIEWDVLERFLPTSVGGGFIGRSVLASTFAAALELTRAGQLEISQARPFDRLFLRRRRAVSGGSG